MAAIAAYRHVLRATGIAFRGDRRVLLSARETARSSFNNDRILAIGSEEAQARIQHAEEVAQLLRHNVVQGEKIDGNHPEDRYKLNIHEETERGDNDFNRLPGKKGLGVSTSKSGTERS